MVVSVQSAEVTEAVAVPATALSTNAVIPVLTVSPQVPVKSPVVGSANPSKDEKLVTALNMSYCVLMGVQLATCTSSISSQVNRDPEGPEAVTVFTELAFIWAVADRLSIADAGSIDVANSI